MATRTIKKKIIVLSMAGRVFRYHELIEEIIGSSTPIIDLTVSSNRATDGSIQYNVSPEVIDLTAESSSATHYSASGNASPTPDTGTPDNERARCDSSSQYSPYGFSPRYEPPSPPLIHEFK